MTIRGIPTAAILALVTLTAGCGGGDTAVPTSAAPTTSQALDTTTADTGGATTTATTVASATTVATTATTTTATTAAASTTVAAAFAITSADFDDGGTIPERFTCEADNLVPAIAFTGIPAGTRSLALTLLDPDADDFVHWIAWNIPPEIVGFDGDVPGDAELPDGTRQAANDFAMFADPGELGPGGSAFRTIGYDGPCPGNVHTYVFTLYALSGTIDLPGGSAAAEALAAVEGADAIATVSLTGLFGPDG